MSNPSKSSHCISLIGMSGVGKSTLGKTLAKSLDFDFYDTDELIKAKTGEPLQDTIDREGDAYLMEIERQVILELNSDRPAVFSTGGSVVYYEDAMEYLGKISHIVYLEDTLDHILSRVSNVRKRGIIGLQKTKIEPLFAVRKPLYEQYADITVPLVFPFQKSLMNDRLLDAVGDVLPK